MDVCAVCEFWARPRTFGCVAMGSALLFIVRSRLLVYSAESGVTRVHVVLSGFSKRLFCFVQAKLYVCMVVCISWLHLYCVFFIVVFPILSWSSSFAFYYHPVFWEILLHKFLHSY